MGRLSLIMLATVGLAACVPPHQRPRSTPVMHQAPVSAPLHTSAGLEMVMGRTASALIALFGDPGLDLREGPARKLQFLGATCVLDAYLYPPRRGGDPVVTHIDARLPDGHDTDKAACVAALSRR